MGGTEMRNRIGLCVVLSAALVCAVGSSYMGESIPEETMIETEGAYSARVEENEEMEREFEIVLEEGMLNTSEEDENRGSFIEEEFVTAENESVENNENFIDDTSISQGDAINEDFSGEENDGENEISSEPSSEPITEQGGGEAVVPETNPGSEPGENPSTERETTDPEGDDGIDLDNSDLGLTGSGGEKDDNKGAGNAPGKTTNDGDQPGQGTPSNASGSTAESSKTVAVEVRDDAPQSRYSFYQNENTGGKSDEACSTNDHDKVVDNYNHQNINENSDQDNSDNTQSTYETQQSSMVYFPEGSIPASARLRYTLYSNIKALVNTFTNSFVSGGTYNPVPAYQAVTGQTARSTGNGGSNFMYNIFSYLVKKFF